MSVYVSYMYYCLNEEFVKKGQDHKPVYPPKWATTQLL